MSEQNQNILSGIINALTGAAVYQSDLPTTRVPTDLTSLTPDGARQIQEQLRTMRLYEGPINGDMTTLASRDALNTFRTQAGLGRNWGASVTQSDLDALASPSVRAQATGVTPPVAGVTTGQAGTITATALPAIPAPTAPAAAADTTPLNRDELRQLQRLLNANGFTKEQPQLAVDGVMGRKTGEALYHFRYEQLGTVPPEYDARGRRPNPTPTRDDLNALIRFDQARTQALTADPNVAETLRRLREATNPTATPAEPVATAPAAAPAPATPAAPAPLSQREIREVETLLRRNGYSTGRVDGVADNATFEGLRAYRTAHVSGNAPESAAREVTRADLDGLRALGRTGQRLQVSNATPDGPGATPAAPPSPAPAATRPRN